MNRQQRRATERKGNAYEQRKTFTKEEVEKMNIAAYDLGVKHTLESANIHCGIGPQRQKKISDGLKLLQQLDFEYPSIKRKG